MAWYVRHEHMYSQPMNLGVVTVHIDAAGKIVEVLSAEQAARCESLPSVFRFAPDPEPPAPAVPVPAPAPVSDPVPEVVPAESAPEEVPAPAPEPPSRAPLTPGFSKPVNKKKF